MQKFIYFLSSKGFFNFIILFIINIFCVNFFSQITYYIFSFVETEQILINKVIYGIIVSSYILIYTYFFLYFFYLFKVWEVKDKSKMYLGAFINLYVLVTLVLCGFYIFEDIPEQWFYFYYYLLPIFPAGLGFYYAIPLILGEEIPSNNSEGLKNPFNRENNVVSNPNHTSANIENGDDFFSRKKDNSSNTEKSIFSILGGMFGGLLVSDKEKQSEKDNPFQEKDNIDDGQPLFVDNRPNPFEQNKDIDVLDNQSPFEISSDIIEQDEELKTNPFESNGNEEIDFMGDMEDTGEGGKINGLDSENKEDIINNLDIDEMMQQGKDYFDDELDIINVDDMNSGEFFSIDEEDNFNEVEDPISFGAINGEEVPNLNIVGVGGTNEQSNIQGEDKDNKSKLDFSKFYIKNIPIEKEQDIALLEKLINAL